MADLKEVHVDEALTDVSINSGVGTFIADDLAPRLPVAKQSDKFFIVDAKREELRQQATNRAPGDEAEVVARRVTTSTYSADDHALAEALPDEIRANADNPIQAEIGTVTSITNMIAVDREIKLATALAAGITATTALGAGWDQDTGDPIAEVKVGTKAIRDAIGRQPNVIGMDIDVFEVLQDHPLIVDRIKYTSSPNQPAIVNASTLAQVFNVDRVVVGSARKNTAPKDATAILAAIWSDTVYIAWVEALGIRTNSMAQTFAWNGSAGAVNGQLVSTWREDKKKSDMFGVNFWYDQKVVTAASGYKLTNALQA